MPLSLPRFLPHSTVVNLYARLVQILIFSCLSYQAVLLSVHILIIELTRYFSKMLLLNSTEEITPYGMVL